MRLLTVLSYLAVVIQNVISFSLPPFTLLQPSVATDGNLTRFVANSLFLFSTDEELSLDMGPDMQLEVFLGFPGSFHIDSTSQTPP